MKYRAYPEYKDSGVGWMGKVPIGWTVNPCRAVVSNVAVKNEGGVDQNYLSLMANIGVIRYEDKGDVGNKKPEDLSKCKIVKKGNLVINSMNYSIGSYGMSPYDGVCSPVYIVLDTDHEVIEQRFALRVFENKPFQKYLATFGNGILEHRAAIGWDDIKGAYVAVPSMDEQLAILNFLDHETAKIDTLIEKQQQLIKLLKEKRQAVISQAVTKGLNPNAPMKDSGIEWLGDVPEHWKTAPIKHIVSIPVTDGPHETPNFQDYGVPFISAEAISSGEIDFGKMRAHISEEDDLKYSEKYSPKKYDIYMVKSGATTGITAIVETDKKFNIWSPLAVIRCGKDAYPYFVLNFMRSLNFQEAIELNWSFGTQQNIGMGVIENLHITCPPIKEAKAIAEHLETKNTAFNKIVTKAVNQIELLQERRTALISAAVTGKIDVRKHQ